MFGTKRIAVVALTMLACIGAPLAATQRMTEEGSRIESSLAVLQDLATTPDKAIPRDLLARAEAVVVIPSLVKGGFIVGAKHGRGVMSVRHGADWSSPGFVTLTGASIGWQVGVQSVDLVLLVMNRKGVEDLLADRFTLGGTASVAAGPVGRSADAATDAKLSSQLLAYSRTSGLFAGATLEGAALRSDKDSNQDFYDHPVGLSTIVSSSAPQPRDTKIAETWRTTLRGLAGPAVAAGSGDRR